MNSCGASSEEESPDQNEKFTAETYVDHSLPLDSPWTDGVSGDPPVLPRVGNQYQVDIPSAMEKSIVLQLQHFPDNDNDLLGLNYCTGRELPVPIMWTSLEGESVINEQPEFPGTTSRDHTIEAHKVMDNNERWIYPNCCTVAGLPDSLNSYGTCPQGSTCKTEVPYDKSEHVERFARLTSLECKPSDNQRKTSLSCSQSRKTKVSIPLPGSPVTLWSNAESQSFLLGLYIFGKNLVQVKSFVDSKEMGDVLSFYYGKFYRSDAHRRWVDYRKLRSRRCILGHRIFTGWRQQELLSRILPNSLKESQDTLLEAVKNFNEGRTSLEEFVFTLKAMVGMEALVQAIGIGKGKQDLTGIIVDHVRTNAVIPIRPEIPIGKACSSLTSEDIVKFLTGDFRLSKARSNDLFWEAVWPRLLARGWHSEQPNDISSLSSRNALVFLMPGIKKFSRRKLVKGNHYFDSVSDVLNKVASDPGLLRLETEGVEEGHRIDRECQRNAEAKLGQNGVSDHQRQSYLRPRVPDCNSELMKFTVVDTSLVQGEEPFKVRELRSLPADATTSYRPDRSEETDSESSTEQSSSAADMSCNGQGDSDQSVSDDEKFKTKSTSSKAVEPSVPDHLVADPNQKLSVDDNEFEGQCCDEQIGKQTIKDMKYQFSRRIKFGAPNYLALVSKRQKLTSCKSVGTRTHSNTLPGGMHLKKEEEHVKRKQHEDNKAVCNEVKKSQGKVRAAVLFQDKPQPRTLIDLNLLPQLPPDFETEGPPCMEAEGTKDDLSSEEPMSQSDTKQLNGFQAFKTRDGASGEQQPELNVRRHSTRSRPPTTKALEALACGFFISKRGKGPKTARSSNLKPRSARRARRNVETFLPTTDTNPGAVNPSILMPTVGVDGEHRRSPNQTSSFGNSHVRSERNETRNNELFGVL